MDTGALDLTDDDALAQAHAVLVASRTVDRPTFVAPTRADLVADWRHDDPGEDQVLSVVRRDGRVVGLSSAWYPLGDNTDKVWADIDVHPDARRQGVGSALLTEVLDLARRRGRRQVVIESAYPLERADDHPYRRFAESRGFRLGATETTRRLALPVPAGLLAQLAEHARNAYAGAYTVSTYDELPDPLIEPVCRLGSLVSSQAPWGELEWEPESMTPERYAGYRDVDRAQGRVRLTSLAVHRVTGEVVAYTEIMLRRETTRAQQWGTLVDEAHRGHRLGLAVKVANLRALQAAHPDRMDVTTSNAVDNPWMVAINEQLGFRPAELLVAYVRDL